MKARLSSPKGRRGSHGSKWHRWANTLRGGKVVTSSPALCGSQGRGWGGSDQDAGGISAAGAQSGRTCLAPGAAQQGSPHAARTVGEEEREGNCRRMRKMHGEGTNPEIVRTWRRATAGDWVLCHGASTPLPLPPGLPCARHTCSVPLGHPPGRSRLSEKVRVLGRFLF